MAQDSAPQDITHAGKSLSAHRVTSPDRVGNVAMGSRKEFSARVRELVETDREVVMTHLAAGDAAKKFIDAVIWGTEQRPPDRTCMNLRAQIMKSIEQDRAQVQNIYLSLGVKDENEAAALISAAKSVEGASPHDTAEVCISYLVGYFDQHPEQRAPAIKRQGGYIPVEVG